MLMQVQIAQGLEMCAVRIAAARGIVFIFFSSILVINTSTNISIGNAVEYPRRVAAASFSLRKRGNDRCNLF